MLVDTTKPSSSAPLYVTYLSEAENRIAAIRVDSEGNAYVTGTTASLEFPHQTSLDVGESSGQSRPVRLGFVSVLNPSGSALLWSTLLQMAQLTALALDGSGNVYVTGRAASGPSCSSGGSKRCDEVLVAKLSDRGSRLSYVGLFGGSAHDEGRAISIIEKGQWVIVAGDTDSPDFPVSSPTDEPRRGGVQSFAVALPLCKPGILYSRVFTETHSSIAPGTASTPALDAFTSTIALTVEEPTKVDKLPIPSVQIAPACPSNAR
jgi:hypothetical protein